MTGCVSKTLSKNNLHLFNRKVKAIYRLFNFSCTFSFSWYTIGVMVHHNVLGKSGKFMSFLLLAGGFLVILVAVIIAVISAVVSAVAADQDVSED